MTKNEVTDEIARLILLLSTEHDDKEKITIKCSVEYYKWILKEHFNENENT